MKKILFFTVTVFVLNQSAFSQVGIGTGSPNANSILDLSNTSQKLLVLPVPSSAAPTTFDTEAMMFYFGDYIYLKTSATTFNVLSPWAFDGNTANGTYTPSGTRVGIGIATSTLDSINLKVAGYGEVRVGAGSPGSISIGTLTAQHLLFDTDEILSKSNATTAGTLKLQEGGGTVQVGQSATVTSTLNVYGNIQNNGMDLLPLGTIIMWAGTITSGNPVINAAQNTNWEICDGTALPVATQTALGLTNKPDLRERFIVGAGTSDNASVTGTTQYAVGAGGNGNNYITLTTGEMPSHSHTATIDPGGDHTHTYTDNFRNTTSDGGGGGLACRAHCGDDGGGDVTGSAGSHSHTITINASGTGGAHENRPPYYGLFFIMKVR